VARFAVHPGVLAGLLHIEHVTVTCLTSLVPGEVFLVSGDLA
jgi:hypothetical protein